MEPTSADRGIREQVRAISRTLQDLHRTLLDYQRRDYEKHFGRIGSDFYVLQLAAEDPQFAWLRALSTEMMRIDQVASGKEPLSSDDLLLTGTRVRYLLSPDADGNSFQSHYDRAMQTNPDIIMAHAAAMRSLPSAREHVLFRGDSTNGGQDTDPEARKTWQPGTLLPGHGDHGYRALSSVTTQVLEPGSSRLSINAANELALILALDGAVRFEGPAGSMDLDPSRPLVLVAGTGLDYHLVTADAAPATLLQAWIRPSSLGGEPAVHAMTIPPVDAGSWRSIAGPEEEATPSHHLNSVAVSDIRIPAGSSVILPTRDTWDTFFLVLEGHVEIDGISFAADACGLALQPQQIQVTALQPGRLVAFVVDPRAKITRAGRTAR